MSETKYEIDMTLWNDVRAFVGRLPGAGRRELYADLDDLTTESIAILHKKLCNKEVDASRELQPFAYEVARRLWANFCRRAARVKTQSIDAEWIPEPIADGEDLDALLDARALIGGLPKEISSAVVLHAFGFKGAQWRRGVQDVLGVSRDVYYKRLRLSHAHLSRSDDEEGIMRLVELYTDLSALLLTLFDECDAQKMVGHNGDLRSIKMNIDDSDTTLSVPPVVWLGIRTMVVASVFNDLKSSLFLRETHLRSPLIDACDSKLHVRIHFTRGWLMPLYFDACDCASDKRREMLSLSVDEYDTIFGRHI